VCDFWDDNQYVYPTGKHGVISVDCRLHWIGGVPATAENPTRFTELFDSETSHGLYDRLLIGYSKEKFNYRPWESWNDRSNSRRVFQPGEAVNGEAKCRVAILAAMEAAGARDGYLNIKRMAHDRKWGNRLGDRIVKNAISSLQEMGEIVPMVVETEEGKKKSKSQYKLRNWSLAGGKSGEGGDSLPPISRHESITYRRIWWMGMPQSPFLLTIYIYMYPHILIRTWGKGERNLKSPMFALHALIMKPSPFSPTPLPGAIPID
jgi:hypothetical protein